MRKKVYGYQLNRDRNERQALFRSLISELLMRGQIETTLTKAKAIQPQVERLITKAKKGRLIDRRMSHRFLTKRSFVSQLFDVVGPLFKETAGGYTRIIKVGFRKGDGAPLARISLTKDFVSEIKETKPEIKKTGQTQNEDKTQETKPVVGETKTILPKKPRKPSKTKREKVKK